MRVPREYGYPRERWPPPPPAARRSRPARQAASVRSSASAPTASAPMPGGSGAVRSSRSRAVSVTSSAGTPRDIRRRIMSAARARSGALRENLGDVRGADRRIAQLIVTFGRLPLARGLGTPPLLLSAPGGSLGAVLLLAAAALAHIHPPVSNRTQPVRVLWRQASTGVFQRRNCCVIDSVRKGQ